MIYKRRFTVTAARGVTQGRAAIEMKNRNRAVQRFGEHTNVKLLRGIIFGTAAERRLNPHWPRLFLDLPIGLATLHSDEFRGELTCPCPSLGVFRHSRAREL